MREDLVISIISGSEKKSHVADQRRAILCTQPSKSRPRSERSIPHEPEEEKDII